MPALAISNRVSVPLQGLQIPFQKKNLGRLLILGRCEINATYQNSPVGIFWPLVSTSILCFFLSMIFIGNSEFFNLSSFMYVYSGYVFWSVFSGSIKLNTMNASDAAAIMINHGYSLTDHYFVQTVKAFHPLLVNMPLLLVLFAFQAENVLAIGFVPFFCIVLFLMCMFMSIVTSVLCSLVAKLGSIIGLGLQFLFFCSPIFWNVDETSSQFKITIYHINPVSYLLELQRLVFTGQNVSVISAIYCLIFFAAVLCALVFLIRTYGGFILNVR